MPRFSGPDDAQRLQEVLSSLADTFSSLPSATDFMTSGAFSAPSEGMRDILSSIKDSLKPISEAAEFSFTVGPGGPGTSPTEQPPFLPATGGANDLAEKLSTFSQSFADTVRAFADAVSKLSASVGQQSVPLTNPDLSAASSTSPQPSPSYSLKPQNAASVTQDWFKFSGLASMFGNRGTSAGSGGVGDDCCERLVSLFQELINAVHLIDDRLQYGGFGPGGGGGPKTASPAGPPKDFPWGQLGMLLQRGFYGTLFAPTAASAVTQAAGSGASSVSMILDYMKAEKLSSFGGVGMGAWQGAGFALAGTTLAAELVDKLRNLANQISTQNANFGRFSANMQRVAVDKEIFDIQLSHERGERRSAWAGDFEKSRQRIEREWSKTDDVWDRQKAKLVTFFEPALNATALAARNPDIALWSAISYAVPPVLGDWMRERLRFNLNQRENALNAQQDSTQGGISMLVGTTRWFQQHGAPQRFAR